METNIELLHNVAATHSGATTLISMEPISLVPWQYWLSVDTDAWYKRALMFLVTLILNIP